MSDERATDLIMLIDHLLRREIERKRLTHKEVLMVIGLLAGTYIGSVPMKRERDRTMKRFVEGIARDVEQTLREKLE